MEQSIRVPTQFFVGSQYIYFPDHATQIAVSRSGFIVFTRPSAAKSNKKELARYTQNLPFSPLTGGCSEGLDAFRIFFEQ